MILDAAAARARVDAIFDARDDAADYGSPPEALRALGIDSPDLRWLAACDYLDELRDLGVRAINRVGVLLLAEGMAEENAAARGDAGWPNLLDMTDACERIRRYFGNKAASVVREFFLAPVINAMQSDLHNGR